MNPLSSNPLLTSVPQNPIMDPAKVTDEKKTAGAIGYVALGLSSFSITPLVGAITGTISAAKGIWSTFQHQQYQTQVKHLENKLTHYQQTARINLAVGIEEGTPAHKDQLELEKDIAELTVQLQKIEGLQAGSRADMQRYSRRFVASTLSLIPFLGIFAAAAYLRASSSDIKEAGVHGGVEALMKDLHEGTEELRQQMGKTNLVQGMLYPERGKSVEELDQEIVAENAEKSLTSPLSQAKLEAIHNSGGKEIEGGIPVDRGDGKSYSLQAFQYTPSGKPFDPSKPTMVVFHGNAQTALDMNNHAKTYLKAGYQVITLTMGGYAGSQEKELSTTEASTYQDANAAILYLKNQGARDIAVHGTSIGGTLAFAAADIHRDVVNLVVADQTLNKAKDVSTNFVRNTVSTMIPSCMVRGATAGAFIEGKVVPGVIGHDGKPYFTDGLNNERKAASIPARLIAIKTENDVFMGRLKRLGGFAENFADDLTRARYPDDEQDRKSVELPGGHCTWFSTIEEAGKISGNRNLISYAQKAESNFIELVRA